MFFSRLSKIIALVLMFGLTVGCATKLAPKANEKEQEKVKQEVLQLLEKEYRQPFKIVDYSYSYDTHYPAGNCSGETCRIREFGIYKFKVQAIDNSIILMKFKIEDYPFQKYSNGLYYFKNKDLKYLYCSAFGDYWKNHKNDKSNEVLNKNVKYCNERGQEEDYNNAWTN